MNNTSAYLLRVQSASDASDKVAYTNIPATESLTFADSSVKLGGTIINDAPISAIQYSVDVNGLLIDGSITAGQLAVAPGNLKAALDIGPCDVLSLYRAGTRVGEDTTKLYARWAGIASVTQNTNEYTGEEQEIRVLSLLDGLRYFDLGQNQLVDAGVDFRTIINDAIGNNTLNGGKLFYGISVQAADSGVSSSGPINPGSGSLFALLEVLRKAGSTSTVPLVVGVDGSKTLRIEAKSTTKMTPLIETNSGDASTDSSPVTVQFEPVSSSDVVESVRWAIADGNYGWIPFILPVPVGTSTDPTFTDLRTPDVKSHTSSSGSTTYGGRTVTLAVPDQQVVINPLFDANTQKSGIVGSDYSAEGTLVMNTSRRSGGESEPYNSEGVQADGSWDDDGIFLKTNSTVAASESLYVPGGTHTGGTQFVIKSPHTALPSGAVLVFNDSATASSDRGAGIFIVTAAAAAKASSSDPWSALTGYVMHAVQANAVGIRLDRIWDGNPSSYCAFKQAMSGSDNTQNRKQGGFPQFINYRLLKAGRTTIPANDFAAMSVSADIRAQSGVSGEARSMAGSALGVTIGRQGLTGDGLASTEWLVGGWSQQPLYNEQGNASNVGGSDSPNAVNGAVAIPKVRAGTNGPANILQSTMAFNVKDKWVWVGDRAARSHTPGADGATAAYDNVDVSLSLLGASLRSDGEAMRSHSVITRIGDWRLWKLDTTVLDNLAEQEYKTPNVDSATITSYSTDLAPGASVTVQLTSGTVKEDLSVEAITYSLSGEDTSTVIHIGPRLASNPPALEQASREVALTRVNPSAADLSLGGN